MIQPFSFCLSLLLASLPLARQRPTFDVAAFERARVLKAANQYLSERPVTITASHSPRSAGGLHDFFSEGDYWWPDPKNPGGPYVQRDGESNPDNFVEHRRALMRLSVQVPALAAAWKLTGDAHYARQVRTRSDSDGVRPHATAQVEGSGRHIKLRVVDGIPGRHPTRQLRAARRARLQHRDEGGLTQALRVSERRGVGGKMKGLIH